MLLFGVGPGQKVLYLIPTLVIFSTKRNLFWGDCYTCQLEDDAVICGYVVSMH